MENQKYQFKFLKDEAVDLDLFEGGTHRKIADAIFNIINANEDGMTIGLEGSWGSGKSSIIKILQKKLRDEKNESIHYFYFDAWEHEGDPLRRIFLELFIDKVISKLENKEKSKKNNRLIKSLRDEKNKIKHNITSEKVLTTYGKILAASTLLLPFGAALISISSRNSFFIDSNAEPDYIALSGIMMSICPVLIIAFQILRQIKRKIYPPKNKDEELWKIFDQSENTFEFERSTVDFENCFRRVIEKAVSSEDLDIKKIVIVIDNLDRIDQEYSLRIWSTLQTFMQNRNPDNRDKEDEIFKKLWFIVPYDRDGLAKLWENNFNLKNTDNSGTQNLNTAKSFFDKCFQLRIEVPLPVLSIWETYLDEKAQDMFQAEDQRKIKKILRQTRTTTADIPTPREIITYLNQIKILRYYSYSEISIESIAYYVAIKFIKYNYSTNEMRQKIQWAKLPEESHIHCLPENCREELAGLVCGVEPRRGLELIIGAEISNTLYKGDGIKLSEIYNTHKNCFWSIFDTVIQEKEYHHILPASKAVYESIWQERNEENKDHFELFMRKMNAYVMQFPEKQNIEFYVPFMKIIEDVGGDINKNWKDLINNFSDKIGFDNFDSSFSFKFLQSILDNFPVHNFPTHTLEVVNLNNWLDWASVIKEQGDKRFYTLIKPNPQVVSIITNNIHPEQKRIDLKIFTLQHYSVQAGIIDYWKLYIDKVYEYIQWKNENNDKDGFGYEIFSSLLLLIFAHKDYYKLFEEWFHRDSFINYIQKNEFVYPYVIMMQTYYYGRKKLELAPSLSLSFQGLKKNTSQFWKQRNDKLGETFSSLIWEYEQYQLIWDMMEDYDNILLIDILEAFIRIEFTSDLFTQKPVLPKVRNLINFFHYNSQQFDIRLFRLLIFGFQEYSDFKSEISELSEYDRTDYSEEINSLDDTGIYNSGKLYLEKFKEEI